MLTWYFFSASLRKRVGNANDNARIVIRRNAGLAEPGRKVCLGEGQLELP